MLKVDSWHLAVAVFRPKTHVTVGVISFAVGLLTTGAMLWRSAVKTGWFGNEIAQKREGGHQ